MFPIVAMPPSHSYNTLLLLLFTGLLYNIHSLFSYDICPIVRNVAINLI